MPISPSQSEREKRARPTDRRASSPKRSTDIASSPFTVVTKATYDAVIRGGDTQTNVKIKRLCQGRNKIGQAIQLVDGAIRDHNPQVESQPSLTFNKLRGIRTQLEKLYLSYPLHIANP